MLKEFVGCPVREAFVPALPFSTSLNPRPSPFAPPVAEAQPHSLSLEAAKKLILTAVERTNNFNVLAQRLRNDRAEAERLRQPEAALVEQLTAAGVTIFDESISEWPGDARSLDRLRPSPDDEQGTELTERRWVRENNKNWDAAIEVRHQFLANVARRTSAPRPRGGGSRCRSWTARTHFARQWSAGTHSPTACSTSPSPTTGRVMNWSTRSRTPPKPRRPSTTCS
ncbi:hypothetical protein [Saccharothrix sp. ALI-22-I]|uniref:hypothetical protein n=1 Tax=Saccharothrix sp. ALI-22-I TaxID=1933778 RepID=UPI00117AC0F6|nr:hypothetical protein [Saccharothrix sp. ALI-22-I]